MNECTVHQKRVVELFLDHPSDVEPNADSHCAECAAEVRSLLRILRAGLTLRGRTHDAKAVEAGRRRFLDRFESGGPAFTTLLALAGGFFLMGLAAASGSEADSRRAVPLLTAGAGAAGVALAALGTEAGTRQENHPPRRAGSPRISELRRAVRAPVESASCRPAVAGIVPSVA